MKISVKVLILLMVLMSGQAFGQIATHTPVPTPYQDVAITSWTTSQTVLSVPPAERTKVPIIATVGPFNFPVYNSSLGTSPAFGRADYEVMQATAFNSSTGDLTVLRAQSGTTKKSVRAGTMYGRMYSSLPTLTPTYTPTPVPDTPTPTATITPGTYSVMMDSIVAKVGATAGWVVRTNNNINLATLPASQTGSTLVLPLSGLKAGDSLVGFNLVGQVESGGNTVVISGDLRKQTAAAADVTDASVGSFGPVTITGDAILGPTNTMKFFTADSVGLDETFYVLVTATTAGSTDIGVQAVRALLSTP